MSDLVVDPSLLTYLADGLEGAVAEISHTFKPADPAYRADFYRQAMMNLSYSYFAFFHADAEHPDWAPLWNPVYTDQPNPDDIYLYAPIRGDLTYKVAGNRGTCAIVNFNTQKGWVGLVDDMSGMGHARDYDDRQLKTDERGDFELIFSAKRPEGWLGNWAEITPESDSLIVRYRMVDWEKERDPQLSIECLDKVSPKPRLNPEEILERIRQMSRLPLRYNQTFLSIQNSVKERVGTNVFVQEQYAGGLTQQVYWPAVFEIEDGEALILETEMPAQRHYWNVQMNDPYFNAVEIVYRFSSINEATAKFSSDGRFRAVVAAEDPGVPNWLDTGGFHEGTIYGRWFACDSAPMPTLKRVKLADVRSHLPADTPIVTPEQRDDELRRRVRAAQRRRRW